MGFAKAKFKLVGDRSYFEGLSLVDSGAWYTVIDEGLAGEIGVEYTGLTLTSFSGGKLTCREAISNSITLEGRMALPNLCSIPRPAKELLGRRDVEDRIVIGVHALERLRFAIDVTIHKLVGSPGIAMI